MDDERKSVQTLVGYKITRVVVDGYGVQIFGRKGNGLECLIAQSKAFDPCIFDGDGNLFAEIA